MALPGLSQDEKQLVRRAMRRLAIALALIAAAIAGLALLDRYNATQKRSQAPFPEPRALPQPAGRQPTEPSPTAPPTPSTVPQPQQPPPPPVVSNEAMAPSESARPKATEEVPGIKPPPPQLKPTPPQAVMKAPTSVTAKPQETPPSGTAPAQKPTSEKAIAAAPSKAVEPSAPKGYLVQVGVFTTSENARALQAKLAQKGIPSFIETRVVVGPFKDRAEADAVNKQLQEMGLQGVVVTPR